MIFLRLTANEIRTRLNLLKGQGNIATTKEGSFLEGQQPLSKLIFLRVDNLQGNTLLFMVVLQPTLRSLFALDGDLAAVKVVAISDAATDRLGVNSHRYFGLWSVCDKVLTSVTLKHDPVLFAYTTPMCQFMIHPWSRRCFPSIEAWPAYVGVRQHCPIVLWSARVSVC